MSEPKDPTNKSDQPTRRQFLRQAAGFVAAVTMGAGTTSKAQAADAPLDIVSGHSYIMRPARGGGYEVVDTTDTTAAPVAVPVGDTLVLGGAGNCNLVVASGGNDVPRIRSTTNGNTVTGGRVAGFGAALNTTLPVCRITAGHVNIQSAPVELIAIGRNGAQIALIPRTDPANMPARVMQQNTSLVDNVGGGIQVLNFSGSHQNGPLAGLSVTANGQGVVRGRGFEFGADATLHIIDTTHAARPVRAARPGRGAGNVGVTRPVVSANLPATPGGPLPGGTTTLNYTEMLTLRGSDPVADNQDRAFRASLTQIPVVTAALQVPTPQATAQSIVRFVNGRANQADLTRIKHYQEQRAGLGLGTGTFLPAFIDVVRPTANPEATDATISMGPRIPEGARGNAVARTNWSDSIRTPPGKDEPPQIG